MTVQRVFLVAIFLLGQGFVAGAQTSTTEYLVLAPETLYSGQTGGMSVTTIDGASRNPVDTPIEVTLKGSDGLFYMLFEGRTGPAGHISFSFSTPELPQGTGQPTFGPALPAERQHRGG